MGSYIIFFLQLLSIVLFAFGSKITKAGYLALPLFILALLIPVVIFALFFFFKPKEIWIALLSFIPNIYLVNKFFYFNFLPFIALYFAILSILREKEVKYRFKEITILPIIFLGFIKFNVKGVLENSILSLLFAPGKASETPSFNPLEAVGKFLNAISQLGGNSSTSITFINSQRFLNILFFISVSIYILLLFYLFKILAYSEEAHNKRRKRNFLTMVINLIVFVLIVVIIENYQKIFGFISLNFNPSPINNVKAVIAIVAFVLVFLVSLVIYLSRASRTLRKGAGAGKAVLPSNYGIAFLFLLLGFGLYHSKKLHLFNNPIINKTLEIAGLCISVISFAVILIALFKIRSSIRVEPFKKIFGEKLSHYSNLAEKGVLEKSLKDTEDKREFVMLLYFIILYYLSLKRIEIQQSETPNEYEKRMQREEVMIPYFSNLTYLFNQVRYSENELDLDSFNNIKVNAFVLIDYIKNLSEF